MTIKKAIERITWRLKEGGWKYQDDDLGAFNTLIRFVNTKNTEQIQNNELIFKLYILAFGNALKQNGASIYDCVFQKEFHKLFSRPLSSFVRDFQYHLNTVEQNNLLKKYGFSETHHCLTSTEQDNSDLVALNRIIKNKGESEIMIGIAWPYEVIEKNLFSQATQFIDDYVR